MAQALKGSSGRQAAGTCPRPTVLARGSQLPPGVILSGGSKNAVASVVHSSQQPAMTPPSGAPLPSGNGQASMSPRAGVLLATPSASSVMLQAGMLPSAQGAAQGLAQTPAAANTDHEQNLANTKEKTPMCLINELARFNKVQHQYMLTDEQGPAHKKTFFVKLKLGEEEYTASGPSIKKAQHAAADVALEKTAFKHPPPKPTHNTAQAACDGNPSITPTVELNALAMKRGEPAIYRTIEPARPPYYNNQPNFDFRGMYNQRYHYPKIQRIFYMSLKVGQREFIGEGATRQAARHNAAEKALKVLRCLTVPHTGAPRSLSIPEHNDDDDDDDDEEDDDEDENDGDSEENGTDDLKSEISLVHEIALKRGLSVNFEITKESGPPHMRTFVTRCTCGTYLTDGTGNSKKVSKKRAAELMLEELKKLPQLPQQAPKAKKLPGNKKKNRNLIKKANMDYGVGINPISRLIQIQQAKKEREPVYTLVAERGLPRRREFVMQVTVGDDVCTGVGPNKKLAKRNAAEQMLQQLGYSRPSPQPNKSSIKSPGGESGSSGSDKKVKFLDQEPGTARQLVPGVLLLPDGARTSPGSYSSLVHQAASYSQQTPEAEHTRQKTATIAKELLDTGASPTAEAIVNSDTKPQSASQSSVLPPAQQLLYLAHVLGFKVEFSDFPKGTDKEHLSLVMLSTSPPHVSHGSGPTVEASHDMAARTALQELAKMGLDRVTSSLADAPDPHSVGPAGDGPGSGEKWAKSDVEVKTEPQSTL